MENRECWGRGVGGTARGVGAKVEGGQNPSQGAPARAKDPVFVDAAEKR